MALSTGALIGIIIGVVVLVVVVIWLIARSSKKSTPVNQSPSQTERDLKKEKHVCRGYLRLQQQDYERWKSTGGEAKHGSYANILKDFYAQFPQAQKCVEKFGTVPSLQMSSGIKNT